MSRLLLFFCSVFISFFLFFNSYSQQIIINEREFLTGAGFITRDHSTFGLNSHLRLQNRVSYFSYEGSYPDEYEAVVRRCRLSFNGFFINPHFNYYLQVSLAPKDLLIDDNYVHNILRDAFLYYRFNESSYIGIGQTKLPGNRQNMISSSRQQFAERSIISKRYNIDRDFGIMGKYSDNFESLYYNIKAAISTGEGRASFFSDKNLAYTGRIEILPFGEFTNGGDFFEGDLELEQDPKLSVGASYSRNFKANKTFGQRGEFSYEPRDITSIFADVLFKYKGFSFFAEYAKKNVKDPIIYPDVVWENPLIFYTGQGINAQIGYLFSIEKPGRVVTSSDYDISARASYVRPDKYMKDIKPDMTGYKNEQMNYTLGFTKYIRKHRSKVQLNLHYFSNIPPQVPSINKYGAVIQLEMDVLSLRM